MKIEAAQLRRYWLRWLVGAVAILGVPIAYLTGYILAQREHANLASARFRVEPDAIEPFDRLIISGAGIRAEMICSDELLIEVEDHLDELYLSQRKGKQLYIAGQQTTSSQPYVLRIYSPDWVTFVDLRNGAQLKLPACSVSPAQLTANMAAGAILAVSGFTADLFLFGSTGSRMIAGPQGLLQVEEAIVDMVFGATANLCGVFGRITGSSAVKGRIRVPVDTEVYDLHAGVVDRDCKR